MDLRDKARKQPWLFGLLYLVLGGLLFFFFLLWPILKIKRGEPEVTYHLVLGIVGLMLMLLSPLFFFFGNKYVDILMMPNNERPKKQKYIIIGVSVVVFLLFLLLFQNYLTSKGYR